MDEHAPTGKWWTDRDIALGAGGWHIFRGAQEGRTYDEPSIFGALPLETVAVVPAPYLFNENGDHDDAEWVRRVAVLTAAERTLAALKDLHERARDADLCVCYIGQVEGVPANCSYAAAIAEAERKEL